MQGTSFALGTVSAGNSVSYKDDIIWPGVYRDISDIDQGNVAFRHERSIFICSQASLIA